MARIGRDRHAAVLVAEDVGLLGTEFLVVDHTGRAQLRQALRALQRMSSSGAVGRLARPA